jgi:hypothetical protein
MMTTCGCNLEGSPTHPLPVDVREIRPGSCDDRRARFCDDWPRRLSPQDGHQLRQSGGAVDAGIPDQRRLGNIAHRDNESLRRVGVSQGDHPGYVTQGAIQPELAAESKPLNAVRWEVTIRNQKAHGDGKIQTGATLLDARRSQIDGHALERP